MNDLDDDSSDSSSDFAGFTPKDELTASFFSVKPGKSSQLSKDESETESSDDDNFTSVPENNDIELFSEVVKNLEATTKFCINNKTDEQHLSKDDDSHNIKEVTIAGKSKNISDEINAVLLQGESKILTYPDNDEEQTDDEEDNKPLAEYTIPKEGVKITLPSTSLVFRKKTGSKKESDLATILRRKLKANQILIEKVSRLCWLAHGFYLNCQASDPDIMAMALSLVANHNYPKDKFDIGYLTKFTQWFRNIFPLELEDNEINTDKKTLLKRITEKKVYNYKELIILYIAILRGMGINCRLVLSLYPPPVKTYNDLLPKTNSVKKEKKVKEEVNENKRETKTGENSKKKRSKKNLTNNNIVPNSKDAQVIANLTARQKAAELLRSKYSYSKKKKDELNSNVSIQNGISKPKDITTASTSTKTVDALPSPRCLRSGKPFNHPSTARTTELKQVSQNNTSSLSSDEEEVSSKKIKKKGDNNQKQTTIKSKQKNEKKEHTSEDEEDNDKKGKRKSRNIWVEVYVDSKEIWTCVNVIDGNVDCVTDVYKKASHPVLYLVAWNSQGLIKDVTRRYCPHWLSITRKQRVDEKWWVETLSYWLEKETAISRKEDEMLLQKELEQPLPKTIGECKGHPLYVLIRHLLKYEALYPPDCVPLGHLHTGEAIYSRYCVHVLCSRETWLKKARVVKPKQDAYKIVKALPKYDKLSGMRLKDSALELFGEWQTTEYVPPEAKDGIVPRNEYGNVDLFKKCMLPKGTVHINLPGLNRIARKLNIDCASAVVGFNFGCMGAVPAIEGFVVCSEYEDTLREAWETEQAEAVKRAIEKREKRVYGNWKKLIKGLLIREKLAEKYEFLSEQSTNQSNKRAKQHKGPIKKSKIS